MTTIQPILDVLPQSYCRALQMERTEQLEEVRLRVKRAPSVICAGVERDLPLPSGGGLVTQSDLEHVLLSATKQSCYAAADTLRQGFVTLAGGHRIGICGTAVTENGRVLSVKDVSSVAIRVARSVSFTPEPLLRALTGSTLLVGSPGSGKTTLLRGCIAALSAKGDRVGVVDERGELAACVRGVPQLDLGARAEVVCGFSKEQGILLLLRVMNVQWIAVDEITAPEDLSAMRTCSYCGVHLLASAHARSMDELYERPLYKELMQMRLFSRVLLLSPDKHWRVMEV